MKRVGALAAIFDEQGRILLVHQTYNGNKWAYPGGYVEAGESPWDAAVREVREETGLNVEVVRLVSVYHFSHTDDLGFHFLCRVVGGALQVDGGEISEADYFAPHALPRPMTEPGRQRLTDALANCSEPFVRVYDRIDLIQ